MPDTLTLPVRDLSVATPRSRLLRLDLGPHHLPYRAGQVVLAAPHGQPIRKPYSIAVGPLQADRERAIDLLVQLTTDPPAPRLTDLARGDPVDVEGPFGLFHLPDRVEQRDLLFVAGGTGIAPIRAMLWHALEAFPGTRVSLLYSARSADELAFRAELRGLADDGRIAMQETVTRETGASWGGRRGRITAEALAAFGCDPASTLAFVCGPSTLVSDAVHLLMGLGVAASRILSEQWTG
jgi:ferredoxin-NADP reductase